MPHFRALSDGRDINRLVAQIDSPGDPVALADAIARAMQDRGARHSASLRLKSRLRASFSVDTMTDAVIDGYRAALAR